MNAIKLSIELFLHLAFRYLPPCAASLCRIDWVLLTFIYLLFTFPYQGQTSIRSFQKGQRQPTKRHWEKVKNLRDEVRCSQPGLGNKLWLRQQGQGSAAGTFSAWLLRRSNTGNDGQGLFCQGSCQRQTPSLGDSEQQRGYSRDGCEDSEGVLEGESGQEEGQTVSSAYHGLARSPQAPALLCKAGPQVFISNGGN